MAAALVTFVTAADDGPTFIESKLHDFSDHVEEAETNATMANGLWIAVIVASEPFSSFVSAGWVGDSSKFNSDTSMLD